MLSGRNVSVWATLSCHFSHAHGCLCSNMFKQVCVKTTRMKPCILKVNIFWRAFSCWFQPCFHTVTALKGKSFWPMPPRHGWWDNLLEIPRIGCKSIISSIDFPNKTRCPYPAVNISRIVAGCVGRGLCQTTSSWEGGNDFVRVSSDFVKTPFRQQQISLSCNIHFLVDE